MLPQVIIFFLTSFDAFTLASEHHRLYCQRKTDSEMALEDSSHLRGQKYLHMASGGEGMSCRVGRHDQDTRMVISWNRMNSHVYMLYSNYISPGLFELVLSI